MPEEPSAYQIGMTAAQVQELKDDVKEIKTLLQCMDKRLRKIETWRSGVVAVASLIGAGVAVIAKGVIDRWWR